MRSVDLNRFPLVKLRTSKETALFHKNILSLKPALQEVLDQDQTVLDTPHLKMVTVSTRSRTHIPTGWFFYCSSPKFD